MASNANRDMGTGSVKKLMVQMAVPALVGQVVNLLYNVVDRIYIGHIPEIGGLALTGVGLFTPILMLITAFSMCQTMFCVLPCPWNIWDEDAKDYMLLFLPFIGLEIGLIWTLLSLLTTYLAVPELVRGIILCAYPFLITGFIHLDGFMDVSDAIGSCRSLERRREILKDSHVGAFAVIGIVLLMLAQFAFFAAVPENADYRILLFVPAISRCGSSLAVTVLKPMNTSQYAAQKKPKSHVAVLLAMTAAFLAAGFLLCSRYGFVLLGGMAGYSLALRKAYKSLEGMNGDISGYALTISELCAGAVFAIL